MGEAFHRGGPEGDAGTDQSSSSGRDAPGREILVNQQAVEHLADAAQSPQLRMPEIAVFAQYRRIALHGAALLADRGGVVQLHPQRHGVDEQADHGLDAGQLGGPARHRHPEHDVGAVDQA